MRDIERPVAARILVCDDISEVGLEGLFRAGLDVQRRAGIRQDELYRRVGEIDALLVRSRTRVDAELIAAAGRLRLIGRAGFGSANIDLDAATGAGIPVVHSPEGNSVSAGEYVLAMLFNLARHIPAADASLRQGRWEKRRYRGIELRGKTLGVIGMGRVGRAVVELASALQLRVLVHDPQVPASRIVEAGGAAASWDELLAQSDFLTVHVPASDATVGLINEDSFHRMKDRVRFINCSRGGVVDERALLHALRTGKVAGAAVDALDGLPEPGHPLLQMPQVIVTPQLLASTFEAQINVARSLAEQVVAFFERGEVSPVNPGVLGRLRSTQA